MSYHFVSDVLKVGIEQYNHAVVKLREEIQNPEKLLALIDREMSTLSEDASPEKIEEEIQKARNRIYDNLKQIGWRDTSDNFVNLGCTWFTVCSAQLSLLKSEQQSLFAQRHIRRHQDFSIFDTG